jgi:CBS domain-containing protein
VPVVHDGKLVGFVSRADLLRVLASGGANLPDDDRDRPIRSRLLAELRKQKWANPNESDIIVSDGVVYFCGVVGSEETHQNHVRPRLDGMACRAEKIGLNRSADFAAACLSQRRAVGARQQSSPWPGDRRFESISLRERVHCELGPRGPASGVRASSTEE